MRYLPFISILTAIGVYFLTHCASITPPGGGPRDTIPPVLIKSIPENKSLNFSGKSVLLTYDEYLKIENLSKQLIITPIIQDEYEQKIRRNSIEIIFPEPFQDSTTYTFNFQDAIQDITEGNVTLDNVLAFSTGDYIDSLHINGKVREIFTNEPVEDFTVCLYNAFDTLDIFNSPPIYLTRTDEEGKYLIENIKNGIYRLYVYRDANSNLMCDMPKELFGFEPDTIYMDKNIDSVFLKVQYLDMRDIEIQRAGPSGQYYEIKTNKTLVEYFIQTIDTSKTIYHNFGEDKKTIRFYNTITPGDSVQYIFKAMDSLENILIDTLYLKFIESKRDKAAFQITVAPKNNVEITDDFKGIFTFNKPLMHFNFDSIYFKYDSITFQYLHDSIAYRLNDKKDKLSFDIELFLSDYISALNASDTVLQKQSSDNTGIKQKGTPRSNNNKLKFHVGKGSFISVENDSSATIEMEYKLLQPENFGIIRGNVTSEFDHFTIQLMKGKKEVIYEIKNQKEYVFVNVEPGQYLIRVLIDNNGNGKWDPGNIFKNIEPEEVYFMTEEITIRPNWELTDINLTF